MKHTSPKLCMDCREEIPDARKRCWECSYRRDAKRARERMKETRCRNRNVTPAPRSTVA